MRGLDGAGCYNILPNLILNPNFVYNIHLGNTVVLWVKFQNDFTI